MVRNVSAALKEKVFKQEMSDVAIILVSMFHADFEQDIHVSSDNGDILSNGARGTISNGIEYVQFPFEVVFQEQTDNLLARAKIKIDNVSREIMLAIRRVRGISAMPTVRIQVVLSSNPDVNEIDVRNLRFNNIKGTALIIEAELVPKIITGGKYPKATFNPAKWPGIHGR